MSNWLGGFDFHSDIGLTGNELGYVCLKHKKIIQDITFF